jgi:uncharacterized protein (TIGR02284 family)
MNELNKDAVSVLNDLIETCRDGEQGFREASEAVKDSELKVLFTQYSQQRAQFASELRSLVMKLGGNPENKGSVAGAMHRGWINVKSAVTGRDDSAIVSECERGEDVAKASYEKAVKASLPTEAISVVERQYSQVKEAHDRVRDLERAYEGRTA